MQMPEQDSLQATYPLKRKFSFPVGGIRTTPVRVSKYECVCVCVRERERERERECVCVCWICMCAFSPLHSTFPAFVVLSFSLSEVVVLSPSMLKSLNSFQCAFLRTCSGSDAFVPNDFLRTEFGALSCYRRAARSSGAVFSPSLHSRPQAHAQSHLSVALYSCQARSSAA